MLTPPRNDSTESAGEPLGQIAGWVQPGQAAGFLGAVLGAALVLGIYRLVTMGRTLTY